MQEDTVARAGLQRSLAIQIFLAFATAYFMSALIRGITATLAPTLQTEFILSAGDLGLLAGGYFFGFATMQLPLGRWLDRFGSKRVILCFLSVAVIGCLAFAAAPNFAGVLIARMLCGAGVSACLMAPLTAYRLWFKPESQLRANSWMLMTGSLGMVASTLPVQWLLPQIGWRMIFVMLAVMVFFAILILLWRLPYTDKAPSSQDNLLQSYRTIWAHPYFKRHLWMGFFSYGGLMAMQTLWAGPWLVQVSGQTASQAATGLFWINVCMLGTFWSWGALNPLFSRKGWHADKLISWGLPSSFILCAMLCIAASAASWWLWALFFISSSFISLAQPAVGMAFPKEMAGKALSAYNLVIFSGVFVVQWGMGLLIDAFQVLQLSKVQSYQMALVVFLVCAIGGYLRYVLDNHKNPAFS